MNIELSPDVMNVIAEHTETINPPLMKPSGIKRQGRPFGTGGKYTKNPNPKQRKIIGKYNTSPRVKTPEEIEERKHKKRISSLAYYNKNRAEILRIRQEEKDKIDSIEKLVKSITFKLENQDKATIDHLQNIFSNQMATVKLFLETFAEPIT
jgi:hypothetical protein